MKILSETWVNYYKGMGPSDLGEETKEKRRGSEVIAGELGHWVPEGERARHQAEKQNTLQPAIPGVQTMRKGLFVATYAALLMLAVLCAAFLIKLAPSAETSVNITYDVAQIIAAVLGGGGIAAAGLGFAVKSVGSGSTNE